MLNRLQERWKVKGWQLALIFITFAIGGSLTGYAGRKLLLIWGIERGWLWIVLYILLICVLWPVAVLIVSIPLVQSRFFWKYTGKIMGRIGLGRKRPKDSQVNIAIFASGAGSNAQKIIDYFRISPRFHINMIACNKPAAGVVKIAGRENIHLTLIEKERFFRGDAYLPELAEQNIGFIVLAGFMWKVPEKIIHAYRGRIMNIHPALLPDFGGKNMYGHYVHEAVIAHKEKKSGISIHYVDEQYDHGKIIFQASCDVLENDSPTSLAQRIQALEHEHYPRIIERELNRL